MTYQDTVKSAVISASQHALPGLPREAVRWRNEPQKQLDARFPNITISEVSHVPDGPVLLVYSEHTSGELVRSFSQVWFWTIQIRVESWRDDSKTVTNPRSIVNRMRFGWKTLATQRILEDGDESKPFRYPVKVVDQPGTITEISSPVHGHMLPQYIYEIELSYVQYDVDPERDGVIESAEIQGHLGGTAAEDAVTLTTDNA